MRCPHTALQLAAVLAVLVLLIPAISPARAADAPLPVKKAAGSIELTDPVGTSSLSTAPATRITLATTW
jgi:hypothetical protein